MSVLECPICGKHLTVVRLADAPFRPFCSKRCKMIDLGRWLDGTYSISEPIKPEDLQNLDSDHQTGKKEDP